VATNPRPARDAAGFETLSSSVGLVVAVAWLIVPPFVIVSEELLPPLLQNSCSDA
jgi:hypothetical protein